MIGLLLFFAVALISILPWIAPLILSNKIVQPYYFSTSLVWKAAIQLIYWVQMTLVEIFFLALFMVRAFLFCRFHYCHTILHLGTSLGLLAGYYGGALDTLIVRFIDIMLAIPNLLLNHCGGINFRAFFNQCDVGDCRGFDSKLCALNTCSGIK